MNKYSNETEALVTSIIFLRGKANFTQTAGAQRDNFEL